MLRYAKRQLRDFLLGVFGRAFQINEDNAKLRDALENKSSPATKAALRNLYIAFQNSIRVGHPLVLSDTGLRVFSQCDEDGILLYLFAALGMDNKCFVDIGSADGICSNCANLAINFGWHGLFIDGNRTSIQHGRRFYQRHPDTWLHPPKFFEAIVQRENINQLIASSGIQGEIGLLSIDIDGNDYWVWEAIEVVQPKVVIVETHIEFGMRSIVVPYDEDHVYPRRHPEYHGASPMAMVKLAAKKGYRLVGANSYGFNIIFVRKGLAEDIVPEVTLDSILTHPRNKEREKLFEAIKSWDFVNV